MANGCKWHVCIKRSEIIKQTGHKGQEGGRMAGKRDYTNR